MKLYSEKFRVLDNLLDVNTRFFNTDDGLKIKLICANNPSIPENFLLQIKKEFAKILSIDDQNLNEVELTFDQFFDYYNNSEYFENILYFIFKSMTEFKFLPNSRECADFKTKFLNYDKKKFVDLLKSFPMLFIDRHKIVIYSAITDGLDTMFKYTKQFDLFKYCYEAMVVGKEYINDLVAFIGKTENDSYPILNNAISPDLYFAKCEQILERIKTFDYVQ